jgi:hypothetical protein
MIVSNHLWNSPDQIKIGFCLNLKKFKHVIVKNYLCNPPDQIKIRLPKLLNHLFGQVGPINGISQSLARIFSNPDK